MIRREKDGVVWFEFASLAPSSGLRHAVFSRLGGVSTGTHESLNLSFGTGDNAEAVEENRRRAYAAIGLPNTHTFVSGNQVHGIEVHAVLEKPPVTYVVDKTDGLTTKQKGTALFVSHADCQAAIFFDPVTSAFSVVHCGWRGNVQNIYKETIRKMQHEFGTKARDLTVCISPSLGPNRSEFVNFRTELPEPFWRFVNTPQHFDLWQITRWQLETEGVLPEKIELAGHCTFEDATHFFSHRRDKSRGRHYTIAWID